MPPMFETTQSHAALSPAPAVQTEYQELSPRKPINLKDDDHVFVNIAVSLLERHKVKNANAHDAVCSILLPHERIPFWEAVKFRKSQLPMFPVANEDPSNQIVRDLDQLFSGVFQSEESRMASPISPSKVTVDTGMLASTIHSNPGVSSPSNTRHPVLTQSTMLPSSGELLEPSHPSMPSSPQHYQSPQDLRASQPASPVGVSFPESQLHFQGSMPAYRPQYIASPQNQYSQGQQQYYHQSPQASNSPVALNHQRLDTVSPPNNNSPTSAHGSTMSVETQPIQNLTHTGNHDLKHHHQSRQFDPQNASNYGRAVQPHPSMELHNIAPQAVPSPSSIIQYEATAQPRYKQFRPPALIIQQPSALSSELPTHIDIDWNIPIQTTTSTSIRNNNMTQRMSNAKNVVEETERAPANGTMVESKVSPDWNPALPPNATAASMVEKTIHDRRDEYLLDIARNKYLLIRDEANVTHHSLEVRKKLLQEISRVSLMLSQANVKKMPLEQIGAYDLYRTELLTEVEKWNRTSSKFGTTDSSRQRSLVEKTTNLADESPDHENPNRHSLNKVASDPAITPKGVDDDSYVGSNKVSIRSPKSDDFKVTTPLTDTNHADGHFRFANIQPRMMKVVAPVTLPGGYQFEARIDDKLFIATVPPGGVAKGEVFLTRMSKAHSNSMLFPHRTRILRDMDAPPHRWRDELFDFFQHGMFHDFLLNSIFCPLVALSQIMARVKLSDSNDPIMTIKSRTHVCLYFWLSLFFIALHFICGYFMIVTKPTEEKILLIALPLATLDIVSLACFLYLVAQTRATIRRKYGIPEMRLHGCEDCCMALFCNCCTIAQMGRHTADYETYQSYCCTDTGLANHVEVKFPVDCIDDIEEASKDGSTYHRLV